MRVEQPGFQVETALISISQARRGPGPGTHLARKPLIVDAPDAMAALWLPLGKSTQMPSGILDAGEEVAPAIART